MRITIDLDNPSILEIQQTWHQLSRHGEVDGRLSSSGSGCHLRVFAGDMSKSENLKLRRIYGDDEKRIEYDMERRHKPFQVLFDRKNGETAGEWIGDLTELTTRYRIKNPESIYA